MIKVSTRGRYGLRIMVELAMGKGEIAIPVSHIEKRQNISGKYVHVLVNSLKKAGLVVATRGPGGGYNLGKSPEKIKVLDIIVALEGKIEPSDCVGDDCACGREYFCAASGIWKMVAQMIDKALSEISLADLVARQLEIEKDRELACFGEKAPCFKGDKAEKSEKNR